MRPPQKKGQKGTAGLQSGVLDHSMEKGQHIHQGAESLVGAWVRAASGLFWVEGLWGFRSLGLLGLRV